MEDLSRICGRSGNGATEAVADAFGSGIDVRCVVVAVGFHRSGNVGTLHVRVGFASVSHWCNGVNPCGRHVEHVETWNN